MCFIYIYFSDESYILLDLEDRAASIGVVMSYDLNGLFTIYIGSYLFLAQNCINLESDLLDLYP